MRTCRFCDSPLKHTFADLGASPLANSYLKAEALDKPEPFFPLHVQVCEKCFLVQLPEVASPEDIFCEYAYFSSYSDYWLEHSQAYVESMVERFNFGNENFVVEIASNDGYLLQYFKQRGIPILGIEPAKNVAKVALDAGIPTVTKFFGIDTAKAILEEKSSSDLLVANNVLAHVPDINDFVAGMKILLSPRGVITVEFPHLVQLMRHHQFDTIYHEHFSYLSFSTVRRIFSHHGLRLFDVDQLETHGGSLRIYGCHEDDETKTESKRVDELLSLENEFGLSDMNTYTAFNETVKEVKRDILDFIIKAKREGRCVAGYGAPAKGNTLLNYCGIRNDFIDYTVDRSPHKQDCFLPGSRIPIYHPDHISKTKPDYLVILPWNIKGEIMDQMSHIHDWGGKFVVFIPKVKVYS